MLAEVFVTLFLFVVVIMVTALLFGGWVIFMIIRLIVRALGAVFSPTPAPTRIVPLQGQSPMVTCSNPRCRGPNPLAARFCRRCGVALPSPQRVAARRAAMW